MYFKMSSDITLNKLLIRYYCDQKCIKSFDEYKDSNYDIYIYFKYKGKTLIMIYVDTDMDINNAKTIYKNILSKEIDKLYQEKKILSIISKENSVNQNKNIIKDYDYIYDNFMKYFEDNLEYIKSQIQKDLDVQITLALPDNFKNMSMLLFNDILHDTDLHITLKEKYICIQLNKFINPF